jgi:hypothetical protein
MAKKTAKQKATKAPKRTPTELKPGAYVIPRAKEGCEVKVQFVIPRAKGGCDPR